MSGSSGLRPLHVVHLHDGKSTSSRCFRAIRHLLLCALLAPQAGATTAGSARAGLMAPDGICEDLREVLPPELKKANVTILARGDQPVVCDVLLGEASGTEHCVSRHPLWSCSLADRSCVCRWSSVCHGITSMLKSAKGLALRCGPAEVEQQGGVELVRRCRCRGFNGCPANGAGWQCSLHKTSTWMPWLGKDPRPGQEAAKMQQQMRERGVCECQPQGEPVPMWLTGAELEALRKWPLGELQAPPTEVNKTAAGKTIKNKIRRHTDGKDTLVLTITDEKKDTEKSAAKPTKELGSQAALEEPSKDHDKDVRGDANAPGKGNKREKAKVEPEFTERCVITDGRPEFTREHWALLGTMLFPSMVVCLVIALMRWMPAVQSWCRHGVAELHTSSPTGPEMPPLSPRTEHLRSGPERRPPRNFVVLVILLVILLKTNVSVILTTSHLMVGAAPDAEHGEGLGGALSGVLIAAEPLGGIVGVVTVAWTKVRRPRETCVCACAAVFLGCTGFIVAARFQSLALMIALRVFAGLGEGALFLGQTYVAKLSSASVRTEVFGIWELGVAAGLIGGPTLTSLCSTWGSDAASGGAAAGESALWVTATMALLLFCAMCAMFPTNAELGVVEPSQVEPACWQMGSTMSDEKWAVVLVTSAGTTVRLLSRLVWEASAVMVLTAHFCLGFATSGYGATFVILFYLVAQVVFVKLCTSLSDHTLVRFCEVIELCGLLIIFRLPRDLEKTVQDDVMQRESALLNVAVFLLGSGLFYTGNCLTAAPLNSWATKRGPREVCVLFYQHIAVQVGVCAGACLSRIFAGTDPHQNTMVCVLLPVVLAQVALSELGLGSSRGKAGAARGPPDVPDLCLPRAA